MDLWPAINGRCLLAGINLKTMEASDMCDVIHAQYEADAIPLYEEHMKIKSDVRVAMWRHIYEKDYPYPHTESNHQQANRDLPPEEALLPDPDAPKPTKPYIPPTNFEQFQAAGLDAPLGGMD